MKKINLEIVSCDLCGDSKYKTRYRKPDTWLNYHQYQFEVVECNNCGLVYLNPRPTIESMEYFYPKGYHEGRNNDEHQLRYRVQTEYLPILNKERILDVGCARGDYLNYLKSIYPNVHASGVDYFSEKVDFDFINFVNKLLPDAKLQAESFDLVTAWAVFEHLHAPSDYFAEVSRVLKRGGKFIFLVTNSESFYGKYAYKEDIPRHTYHFSEETLNLYAHKFNFKVAKYSYETRLWDSTGAGTFKYRLMEMMGSNWERRQLGEISKIQNFMGRIGCFLDSIIFSSDWEAEIGRSGIIVAEFIKK